MKIKETGFTLIELIITMAIGGILLTLAVPSFLNSIANNRATTQANEVLSALSFARGEAIKRGTNVTACSTTNPQSATPCTGSANWATGWVVVDNTNTVLREWDAPSGASSLSGTASVVFASTGLANAAATITLTPSSCAGSQQRVISVVATGRASVTTAACP